MTQNEPFSVAGKALSNILSLPDGELKQRVWEIIRNGPEHAPEDAVAYTGRKLRGNKCLIINGYKMAWRETPSPEVWFFDTKEQVIDEEQEVGEDPPSEHASFFEKFGKAVEDLWHGGR